MSVAAPEKIDIGSLETEVDTENPAEICYAFADICSLERHLASRYLKVPESKLTPQYIADHLDARQAKVIIDKLELIFNSDHSRNVLTHYAETSEHQSIRDPDTRDELVNLARVGMVAAIVDAVLNKNKRHLDGETLRHFKGKLVSASSLYIELIDSPKGRAIEFNRKHLKALLRIAYNAEGSGSNSMPDSLEAGIAAEIGTKRYIERIVNKRDPYSNHHNRQVRYGLDSEDLRGGDLVYHFGPTALKIDVKSSGGRQEPHSGRSRLEQEDFQTFRVKKLYPAHHQSIGDNFEVKEFNYKRVIERTIDEFEHLAGDQVYSPKFQGKALHATT